MPVRQSEKKSQKPKPTAKDSFKKQKISPNTAEEKTGRLGLKDLGRLAEEATKKEKASKKAQKSSEKKQGTKPEPKPAKEPPKTPETKKPDNSSEQQSLLTIDHNK